MPENLPKPLIDHCPWHQQSTPIWTLSLYTLRRNLANYPFPHCLDPKERLLIGDILKSTLSEHAKSPYLLDLNKLAPPSRSYLAEHYYWLNSLHRFDQGASLCIPPSLEWQALINGEDHLTLQCATTEQSWTKTFRVLYDLEEAISRRITFAHNSQFGYLTSNLSNAGTGLSLQIFLHLPLLAHSQKLQDILLNLLPEGISAKSLSHKTAHFTGDVIVLHNPHSSGKAETDLLYRMHALAQEITKAESDLRTTLRNQPKPHWIDRVTKAYGLLSHSYNLSAKDALTNLSLLKLGSDLGWIEGLSDADCNTLFFNIRRAHLKHLFPESSAPEEARALLVKKVLAPSTLAI